MDFRPAMRTQLKHFRRIFEQIRQLRVCAMPRVVMLKGADGLDFFERVVVCLKCVLVKKKICFW